MKFVKGWHCPDLLSGPGNYLQRWRDLWPVLQNEMGKRQLRSAVQAGGHIGTWPISMAGFFRQVYTFEPDCENFCALVLNAQALDAGCRLYPMRALLGCARGPGQLIVSEKSTGQHRVKAGAIGPIPTIRIDDLALPDCDLIQLDVEGCELHALQGAKATLERCRPIVVAEENKRCEAQGFRIGELASKLLDLGYIHRAAIGEDLIFAPVT
jgi:FkbM family methyltransferase